MDLPEELRVELIEELLDRLADQRFSVRGDHLGVLVFGVEVENVVDRDQAHRRPERGLDPLQWAAGVARLDLGEYGGEIGGRPLEALLEPFDDLDDPVGSHWLEHVVDRALLERGHRILVVGGDEDDVTSAGQRFGDLEPRLERHANVEKYDIGLELALQRQGLLAILGLGDDGELGPRLRESRAELRAEHRLVFGDERGRLPIFRLHQRGSRSWRERHAARPLPGRSAHCRRVAELRARPGQRTLQPHDADHPGRARKKDGAGSRLEVRSLRGRQNQSWQYKRAACGLQGRPGTTAAADTVKRRVGWS